MAFARAICLREHKNYNHMTAHVIADRLCSARFCVHDQCSRTVASVKTKLHLMLRPYYIQLHPHKMLKYKLPLIVIVAP